MPLDIPLATETPGYTVVIDGRTYRPLPSMLWHYYDRYAELKRNSSHPAGSVNLESTAVPTGEVWVVQRAMALNYDSTSTTIDIYFGGIGISFRIDRNPTVGANTKVIIQGPLTLKAGDFLTAVFEGTALNAVCDFSLVGYKMRAP